MTPLYRPSSRAEPADSDPFSAWRPHVTVALLLAAPDDDALVQLLHERTRFHSPVTDYDGCAAVAHLLSTIPMVVHDIQVHRQLIGDHELVSFLTGRVGDRAIQAIVHERHDATGAVTEATLMLRPLAALDTAIKLMQTALATPQGAAT